MQFQSVHIGDRETAQNAPTPVTNYALFFDGEYVSNEILSDKKFLKMIGAESMGKEQNKRMMEYVMDQLSGLSGVRQIPMMGGYVFYYNERIFGGIYGSGELLIRITGTSKKYMPDAEPELPYEGTKEMLP